MSKKLKALGIFDSGIGGLSVLKGLSERLPYEELIYLADTLNLPYGDKSASQIQNLSLKNLEFLNEKPIKALIIACNTASAHAYEVLKNRFCLPVFDVIRPSVEKAVASTKTKQIAVLATQSTIQSNVYERLIHQKDPDIKVISIACPLLVSVVEQNFLSHGLAQILVSRYLNPIKETDVDTVILGCTHYPLIQQVILEELGSHQAIIDSSECCVDNVIQFLSEKKLLNNSRKTSKKLFFVSGCPKTFDLKGSSLLKQEITSQRKEN